MIKRLIINFLCVITAASFNEIYYFRWFVFQSHLKKRGDYFFITEFLKKVRWSDPNNVINCPAGHHIYEGRWLDDPESINH